MKLKKIKIIVILIGSILMLSCEKKETNQNKIKNLYHDKIIGDITKIQEFYYVFNLQRLESELINFYKKNPGLSVIENIKYFLPAKEFLDMLEISVRGEILNGKRTFIYDDKYRLTAVIQELNDVQSSKERWIKIQEEYITYPENSDLILSRVITQNNIFVKSFKEIEKNKISIHEFDNNTNLIDSSLVELDLKNNPTRVESFLNKTISSFKYDEDNFLIENIISKSYEKDNETISSKIIKKDIHNNWIRRITTIDNKNTKDWYTNNSIHNCFITIRNITYSEWSNIYRK